MAYGRAVSNEEFDPNVVQAFAQRLGLELTAEEANALTIAWLNQLAAMKTVERFDLDETVPVLKMDADWHE